MRFPTGLRESIFLSLKKEIHISFFVCVCFHVAYARIPEVPQEEHVTVMI